MVTDEAYAKLRDRVILLEGQVNFLYKHLGVTFVPETNPGDDPRVVAAIQKGNLLEAIKVYREISNTGFEQAKAAVEEIKGRLGI
jgi:ribosomal protein L7/L12